MARYENLTVGKLHVNQIWAGSVNGQLGKKLDMTAIMASGRKETRVPFSSSPLSGALSGAGPAVGTTGTTNVMVADGEMFEYHVKGTQTILAPVYAGANGLNISMDQTANDGVEITQGISSRSKSAFVVGTDPAFFFRATLKIADVDGTDDCAVGFRKAEAYQAAIDDYDEMAAINVISGDINIETILNGDTTVTTDTTDDWADNGEKTIEIRVSKDGAVTYLIDGDAPTTVAAFSFDDGEVVVPFIYFLHDANLCDTLYLKDWECGYQDLNN